MTPAITIGQWTMLPATREFAEFRINHPWETRTWSVIAILQRMLIICDFVVVLENDHPQDILRLLQTTRPSYRGVAVLNRSTQDHISIYYDNDKYTVVDDMYTTMHNQLSVPKRHHTWTFRSRARVAPLIYVIGGQGTEHDLAETIKRITVHDDLADIFLAIGTRCTMTELGFHDGLLDRSWQPRDEQSEQPADSDGCFKPGSNRDTVIFNRFDSILGRTIGWSSCNMSHFVTDDLFQRHHLTPYHGFEDTMKGLQSLGFSIDHFLSNVQSSFYRLDTSDLLVDVLRNLGAAFQAHQAAETDKQRDLYRTILTYWMDRIPSAENRRRMYPNSQAVSDHPPYIVLFLPTTSCSEGPCCLRRQFNTHKNRILRAIGYDD
jgi:hypothetical protein